MLGKSSITGITLRLSFERYAAHRTIGTALVTRSNGTCAAYALTPASLNRVYNALDGRATRRYDPRIPTVVRFAPREQED